MKTATTRICLIIRYLGRLLKGFSHFCSNFAFASYVRSLPPQRFFTEMATGAASAVVFAHVNASRRSAMTGRRLPHAGRLEAGCANARGSRNSAKRAPFRNEAGVPVRLTGIMCIIAVGGTLSGCALRDSDYYAASRASDDLWGDRP